MGKDSGLARSVKASRPMPAALPLATPPLRHPRSPFGGAPDTATVLRAPLDFRHTAKSNAQSQRITL